MLGHLQKAVLLLWIELMKTSTQSRVILKSVIDWARRWGLKWLPYPVWVCAIIHSLGKAVLEPRSSDVLREQSLTLWVCIDVSKHPGI
jgi:hypothetical protein